MRLVDGSNEDFAELVARLLVFGTWRLALFERLSTRDDPVLAAIAGQGRQGARPITATTPRSGWYVSVTAPIFPTPRCRTPSTVSGRSSTSCSSRRDPR